MSYQSTVSFSGQNMTATLNGSIRLEEGRGRMVIQDTQTLVELVNIDRTGFLFSDGVSRRIKLGMYAARVGLWISQEGEDVISLLGG